MTILRPKAVSYKIFKSHSGNGVETRYALNIPAVMAEVVPDGSLFSPEFCDEGILFRFVDKLTVDPPSWARNGEGVV